MLARTKLLMTAFAVVAMMLALGANAAARNLSVSERNFELDLEAGLSFEAAGNTIRCPITILGEFMGRTMTKVANSRIGSFFHIAPRQDPAPPCTGGTTTVLTETLPWSVNYVSFTGRLPRIEAIRMSVIGAAFKVRTPGGLTCLISTTAAKPAFGEALLNQTTGRVENFRIDETRGIPLGGGFLCETGGEGFLKGTARMTDLPELNALVYFLI